MLLDAFKTKQNIVPNVLAFLMATVGYGIMLTALRFADAFQHTYDVFLESQYLLQFNFYAISLA